MSIAVSVLSAVLVLLGFYLLWNAWRESQHKFQKRWELLEEKGLVVDASDLERLTIERVIVVDLGCEEETWLLETGELKLDHRSRIIEHAYVLRDGETLPVELDARKEEMGPVRL